MKVNPIQVAMPFRGMNKVDKPENKIANAKVQTAPAIKAAAADTAPPGH